MKSIVQGQAAHAHRPPQRPGLAAESTFRQIFRSIGGGEGVAVLIGSSFDESSENDSKNGLLSVSGYVLDVPGLDGFIPEWRKMLACYGLEFFHMAECNACNGIYKHLTEGECDRCAREAIHIARKYPLHGRAFILDQIEYRSILQDQGFDCDPYAFMVWCAFIHENRWVHENRPNAKIKLFFESGYKSQSRVNELLQIISQDKFGGRNHVVSHSFVKKEYSEPSQAADLIAWHIRKGYENRKFAKPIRRDTVALFEDRRILTIEFTGDLLKKIQHSFIERSGSLEIASRALFSQIDQSAEELPSS